LNVSGQRFTDDYLAQLGAETPLGRAAQREEVATAYVYLAGTSPPASPLARSSWDVASSFTIGEIIAATGGYTDSW
jgi:NAD(P)-dependent dehydrogenase (short-subunit alcohol dehydrogenase family)